MEDNIVGGYGEVEIIISIIVPTYNRSSVINRAIKSIKEQTFQKWECLVVDDFSTDNSSEIIGKLIEDDCRFSYITNRREKGAPGARNTGILSSRGDYIVLFDSDNVMHPDFLKKVYGKIVNDKVDICSSFSSIIDDSTGKKIGAFHWEGHGYIHKAILKEKSYFDNSSTLIKKEKLLNIGLLDENCPSFQEWDTHIRLSKISTYSTCKEELIDYYRGGSDAISRSLVRAVSGRIYILNKFENDFIQNSLVAYVKNCADIYSKLNRLEKSGETEKLTNLWNDFEKNKNILLLFIARILNVIRNIYKNII